MVSRGRFGGLPPCRGWWNPFHARNLGEATSLGVVATATCGCRSWGITAIKNRWRTRRGGCWGIAPGRDGTCFASVSSDDFRQVGLGCAQDGRPCVPCRTERGLDGVADGCCRMSMFPLMGLLGPPWRQSVGTAFCICTGPGTVQWLCRLRLDDGPGGEVTPVGTNGQRP